MKPKIIVAIGGGTISKGETLAIDKQIIRFTKKKHPRLLFIPTATTDSQHYIDVVQKYFGKKLGCSVDDLCLIAEKPSNAEMRKKILSADIIYVGGGNTLKMMTLWRRLGVDRLLTEAYNRGTVLSGISAGSICWFQYGHSDSMSFYNPRKWNYIRVKGLGLLKGIHCPHYDGHTGNKYRRKSFHDFMKKYADVGIAVDNHCAVAFVNGKGTVLRTRTGANAYRVTRKRGKIVEERL